MKVLGLSASLRNARFGFGNKKLVDQIRAIESKEGLVSFLTEQTGFALDEFFQKGREEGLPFTEMYRKLRTSKGDRGLSNSEGAMAAALWGAMFVHPELEYEHIGLAQHFPATGGIQEEEKLRAAILSSEGFILSGPVYFGDRGSLAQSFFEYINKDDECREHMAGKVFAGVSVGAKRNGGQETSLVYQMVDASNAGMLAVGNDAETTSQYGGTAVAGDIGTFAKDEYGIKTCISTGRRVASMTALLTAGRKSKLRDKLRVGVWLLQDESSHKGRDIIQNLLAEITKSSDGVEFEILDMTDEYVHRCIACDVCPIEVGPGEEYRCIIKQRKDLFVKHHEKLLSYDAIMFAAYSPKNRINLNSVYQQFIERSRYIRRDDYQFSNMLFAPLIVSEIGSNQNLHIRMMTSQIRHHTLIHRPLLVFEHNNELLTKDAIETGRIFVENAKIVYSGRLSVGHSEGAFRYNPVGYFVSQEKNNQDIAAGKFSEQDRARKERLRKEQVTRIE